MAEVKDEVLVNENTPEVNEPKKSGKGAAVKEWFRKKIVALKRKPQTIPMVLLFISSVFYLLCLQTFSQTIFNMAFKMGGFSIFINTLFSILILVLFLNTFPKPKTGITKKAEDKGGKKLKLSNGKVNFVMLALMCLFLISLVVFDIVFIKNFRVGISVEEQAAPIDYSQRPYLAKVVPLTIAHLVLLGVFAVAFALLPLYAKLIRKIDTSKKIEGSQLKEVIETQED